MSRSKQLKPKDNMIFSSSNNAAYFSRKIEKLYELICIYARLKEKTNERIISTINIKEWSPNALKKL